MLVVVGRLGRAHGIRGEIAVDVRTDSPEVRFAVGANLTTDKPGFTTLTVSGTRWHNGRLLVRFAQIPDRTVAEGLSGVMLEVDVDPLASPEDSDEFYDHQLVGLAAMHVDGSRLGAVESVIHLPGQDLLSVRLESGSEALIPFVLAIVPAVDLEAGTLTVDPPGGLLDPEAEAAQ